MSKSRILSAGLTAALALTLGVAACGGGGGTSSSCSKTWKVGLVTDVGKLSDKSFNASSWQGVQDAQKDSSLCVKANYIESNQPTDYQKNMQTFVDQKYDLVIAVGFLMTDDVLASAKKNPNTKFAAVDVFEDQTAPGNLTGLTFKEDQAGFLAGALAGYMTKSNTIGEVLGLEIPPVIRYATGYESGAKYANKSVKVLKVYQGPGDGQPFNNPDWGKARAVDFINQGADIVFGGGGNTGNGALLGVVSKGKTCIGVDTDQFLSYPDADSCLITSAEKHLATSTKTIIQDLVKGQWPSQRTLVFDATNNGVGLAPYHNFDSKVPADVKKKIDDIQAGLKNGTISTGA
jgi:basic membrane protein A and related proteins